MSGSHAAPDCGSDAGQPGLCSGMVPHARGAASALGIASIEGRASRVVFELTTFDASLMRGRASGALCELTTFDASLIGAGGLIAASDGASERVLGGEADDRLHAPSNAAKSPHAEAFARRQCRPKPPFRTAVES